MLREPSIGCAEGAPLGKEAEKLRSPGKNHGDGSLCSMAGVEVDDENEAICCNAGLLSTAASSKLAGSYPPKFGPGDASEAFSNLFDQPAVAIVIHYPILARPLS